MSTVIEIDKHLIIMVNDKVNWCIEKFEEHYNHIYKPKFPTIEYNIYGKHAGWANYQFNLIKLNGGMLTKYEQQFVDQTVVHEMAHLFVNHEFRNIMPHGKEWKSMMILLGIDSPTRCHNFDTIGPVRSQKRYKYTCDCGLKYKLSTTLHNKISRGITRICSKCESKLRYLGLVS